MGGGWAIPECSSLPELVVDRVRELSGTSVETNFETLPTAATGNIVTTDALAQFRNRLDIVGPVPRFDFVGDCVELLGQFVEGVCFGKPTD